MAWHEEDRRAVQRCLDGESAAFSELLERYKNQVFSLILRMVQNPSDAEDLAQDAFIKAFKNLASYDPSYSFLTWLFKIAHNTTIDFLRARKPQAVSISDDDNPLDLAEPGGSPRGPMDFVLQEAVIERLLSSLPPLYREAVLLRYKEGLDLKEIGHVLQIPEGTVKIRLHRAKGMLQRDAQAAAGMPETRHETFGARRS